MRHNHGLRAQSGVAWSPALVATALWLDASDTASVTTSGGAVSQWNDKSGNQRHATQATASNRPTYVANALNGKAGISFNGSSQWFSDYSSYSAGFFCAVASTSQVKAYAGLHTGSNSELILSANGSEVISAGAGGIAYVNSSTNRAVSLNTAFVWSLDLNVERNSARTLGQETNEKGAGRSWNGYCYELIVLPVTANESTRLRVEGYLAHKWGLTSNLPANHPYKNSSPFAGSQNFDNISLLLNGDGTNGAQNNTFIDSGPNNLTVTRIGNIAQGSYSPYPLKTSYSQSANGGSAYFPANSGNVLTVPDSSGFAFGTSNFTIEAWLYRIATGTRAILLWNGNNAGSNATSTIYVTVTAGGILESWLQSSSGASYTAASSSVFPSDQWTHYAMVRNGNTLRQYINGALDGSVDVTGASANDSSESLKIGHYISTGSTSDGWKGYISDLRIVNGTAIYTTNFTPPTEPLEAVANTQLLLRFANAGVVDATGNSVLETIGNAQISTTQKKYGTGALYFDGSADWLIAQPNGSFAFGTGDFTVEAWIYQISQNLYSSLAEIGNHLYSNAVVFLVGTHSGAALYAGNFYGTGTLTTNQWQHVAWVRSSGTLKIFVDGINTSTTAFTNNLTDTSSVAVGYAPGYGGGSNYYMNGYIDDLRITKGVARYTANFTPPSSAFPLS